MDWCTGIIESSEDVNGSNMLLNSLTFRIPTETSHFDLVSLLLESQTETSWKLKSSDQQEERRNYESFLEMY